MQQVEGITGEDGGTYFVDQSGQYYYQASGEDTPVLTQVQIQEVSEENSQNEEVSQDSQNEEMLEYVEAGNEVSTTNFLSFADLRSIVGYYRV